MSAATPALSIVPFPPVLLDRTWYGIEVTTYPGGQRGAWLTNPAGRRSDLRAFTDEESAGICQVIDTEAGLPAYDARPEVDDDLTVMS